MTEEQSKKVFNALRAKILDGAFASRFPSERTLMRQYSVTRTGIRTILAKLESQHIITRHRGSGTFLVERARERASGIFGIIIPNAKSPFYAAMIDGISKSVKNSGGGGEYSLLISDLGTGAAVPRAAERLADLCLVERVTGVFFRPLPTKQGQRTTSKILSRFREAKIPVILIDGDFSQLPEGTGCDIVAAKGYPDASPVIAALLGDIAFRLMLQRLAYPSHPPAEVLLDPPVK